jgi:pyrimidine operon attenuation protein/uracil phosphoribosyltransferase
MEELLVAPDLVMQGLDRVATEIAEGDAARSSGTGTELVLVGIRRGGEPIARELARILETRLDRPVQVGSVDITLYRDDAATALPNPRIGPSHIPFDITGTRVVLVDDVLFTGRTIRAALDALLDYGRPRKIELAVVADRGGRELPIQADYVVAQTPVSEGRRVEVLGSATPSEGRADGFRIVATSGRRSRTPEDLP